MDMPLGSNTLDRNNIEIEGEERRKFWDSLYSACIFEKRDREGEITIDKGFLQKDQCIEKLDDVLTNAGWEVMRKFAVMILSNSDDMRVVDILKKGLSDESFDVRFPSAKALKAKRDDSGIPILLKELTGGFTKEGCQSAAFLCACGNEEGLKYAIDFLRAYQDEAEYSNFEGRFVLGEGDHHTYNELAVALAKAGHEDALFYLFKSPCYDRWVINAAIKISKRDALPMIMDRKPLDCYSHVLVDIFGYETTKLIYEAFEDKHPNEALAKICELDHPDIPIVLQGIRKCNESKEKHLKGRLRKVQLRIEEIDLALKKAEPTNPLEGKDLLVHRNRFWKTRKTTAKKQRKPLTRRTQ
jgi:hypothetical protein